MTATTTDLLRQAQMSLTDAHAMGREETVRLELTTGVAIEAKWIPSIDETNVTLYAESKPSLEGAGITEHRIAVDSIIAVSFTNNSVIPPRSAKSYTGLIAKRVLGDVPKMADYEAVSSLARDLYQPFTTADAWAARVADAYQVTEGEPMAIPLAA